jgi:ribosomal protein L3 glutamine methyltransferase
MNFLEHTQTFSTPRDLLRYAVSRFNAEKLFFGHGNTNAFDEAAYLILHTLHLPLDTLDPFLDAKLLPNEIRDVLETIEQRASKRIPAAYITHEAWLKGYSFYVDERVIVPRSFIAELIPEQFSPWVSNPNEITEILDLCTGSGCLAIMLADAFPNAHITAVDISKDALEVAHKNVANYNLDEQITLIKSDVYENLKGKKFDLIISNPPYVNAQSIQALPKEYQQEPLLALAAGEDGMDCVRKIIAHAKEHLNENGILIIEIGNERAYAEAAFGHLNLTWLSTSAGDDMVFLLTKEQLEMMAP